MPVLEAREIRKVYAAGRGKEVVAVKGASFAIPPGEIFGLLGPNGAGKTTLLRIIAPIIAPTSGACLLDGVSTSSDPYAARARIGFLSGNTKLYGRLTVRELLRYFGRLYRLEDDTIAARTKSLSEMLGMDEFLDRRCDTLSTGQTQRANITRVILHDPPFLILDEPTLGLDILSSRTILDFIRDARDRGRCIIFSTHYMTEAELLCDRIALIHKGDILALGTNADLRETTGAADLQGAFLHFVGNAEEIS